MTLAQMLQPELEHEFALTRKLLELCPDDQAQWRPHSKSFSLGDLGLHLASLVHWGTITMKTTELDLNPPGGEPFKSPKFESTAATLATFDKNAGECVAALAPASDADLGVNWSLKNAGETYFTMPRLAVLRTWVLNHMIHHRGQLSVYLRMLDIPLPSIYGPSADSQS